MLLLFLTSILWRQSSDTQAKNTYPKPPFPISFIISKSDEVNN